MKKILLINPYCQESDHIQPPLGLGYLATAVRNENFSVNILDANKEKLKPKGLIKKIVKELPDFVGFQVYSFNIPYVKEALKEVKTFNPKIVTLVGGPHPSAVPQKIFNTFGDFLDFAFAGEAEIGLPKLLRDKPKLNEIPGLVYRQSDQIIINPPLFSQDLDQFDFPAWDLFKPETYPEAQHGAFFKNFPIAPIITTRGCPFNCNFCAAKLNSGSDFRKRKVGNVIEEIKFLYETHHVREFHIVDDNFTLDKNFAKNILEEIIKLKLDATFAVPNGVRLDTLDKKILLLMKEAGFYLISVGIESGSDRVLKMMGKHLTTKKIKEQISLIKKNGLDVAGFFIIGYPGETEKEVKKTIDFSLSLGLLRANYFLFLPLPGTSIFHQLERKEKIKNFNFQSLNFTQPTYIDKISGKKLKHFQREAFLRFYFLRPKILIKNLLEIKRPAQVIFLLKRAVRWLF